MSKKAIIMFAHFSSVSKTLGNYGFQIFFGNYLSKNSMNIFDLRRFQTLSNMGLIYVT
jgi:hypothetical protein